MKSATTKAIHHVFACLAAGALTPCLSEAQIALPGDMDPSGRVYTQITARVGELGSNSPTIPFLTVYVVSADGHRVTLRTTLGGTASAWLARAQYRIVTPEPFQFEGRLYTWDTIAVVRPGMALVRLQLSNAKSSVPVPVVTWHSGDPISTENVREGHTYRTIGRDGVEVTTTLSHNDKFMWADVSVANKSKRTIAVDPKVFTLSELSPAQARLAYLSPTDNSIGRSRKTKMDMNRVLTANTLTPGQRLDGVAYFEPDEKAREVVLRIPLSGVTFDVPFSIR